MRRVLFLLLFLAAPVWAGSYIIALSGGASAATVKKKAPPTLAQQAATMSPGEWKKLDTVNLFADTVLSIAALDAIEARSPGSYSIDGWGTGFRILEAWNTAGYDPAGNRMLFWGGGHSSYGGNEVVEFDFDTLTWTRLTDPVPLSFHPDAAHWLPEDVDPVDNIPDTPGTPHTYDGMIWNPDTRELMVMMQASVYPNCCKDSGTDRFYKFDPDARSWTPYPGHDYSIASCEYNPVDDTTYCIDGLGTSVHKLYLISNAGVETACSGRITPSSLHGYTGNLYRDPFTEKWYFFASNGVHHFVPNGCSSSATLEAPAPSTEELGFPYDWGQAGVVAADDGYIYAWAGDEKIIRYNKTTHAFDVVWNLAYADSGPLVVNGGGYGKVYGKMKYFPTEGVIVGIAGADYATNPRGGMWMWKIGAPEPEADKAKLGTLALDGRTQSTISVFLPMTASDKDFDSSAYIEYRVVGAESWTRGVDMMRQRPEFVSIGRGFDKTPEGFAGMIWGLTPDTEYEVRVTAVEPDTFASGSGAAVQTLSSVYTAPPPLSDYTRFGTTTVTSAAQLNTDAITQCDGAGTGHVFVIPADTTIDASNAVIAFGPTGPGDCGADADNPIVLRGANKTTSKIDCTGGNSGYCVRMFGGHAIIENLTITTDTDSAVVIGGRSGGCEISDVTVRDVIIEGVQVTGINAAPCHLTDIYIADNTVIGPYAALFTTQGGGRQGIVVSGDNIEVEHNTVKGFTDALGTNYNNTGQIHSVAIHHNLVLWSADDSVELDFSHRNVVAHNNLLANTANCLSFQPIWGGPAYAVKNICYNSERGPIKPKSEYDDPVGMVVWNNTFLKNGSGWTEGGGGLVIFQLDIRNNLFFSEGTPYNGSGTDYEMLYQALVHVGFSQFDYNAWNQDYVFSFGISTSTQEGADFDAWKHATLGYGGNDVLTEGETVFNTLVPDFDDTGGGYLFGGLYRDPLGKHYDLAAGSSARNAGVVIPGVTPDGDANPDIGACEPGECDSTGKFYGVRPRSSDKPKMEAARR